MGRAGERRAGACGQRDLGLRADAPKREDVDRDHKTMTEIHTEIQTEIRSQARYTVLMIMMSIVHT